MDLYSQHILIPGAALLCTVVLHILALRIFPDLQLLDFPERYGHKRKPLPYPTGIIAVIVFALFFVQIQAWDKQSTGLMAGIVLLTITSFADDRKQLSPKLRLCIQVIAALVIFGFGTRIYTLRNPFDPDSLIKLDTLVVPFSVFSDPPVWSGLFTIAWLLFTMNALNWFDGIPGQVSLISLVAFLIIGCVGIGTYLSHDNPFAQYQLSVISFILAGCAAGCLLFDFPPHKVLMGDTGAMFFGLMLGVVTIYSGGKVATAALVLGVPLIDSAIVVLRRLYKRESPFRGNTKDEHLHHRLLAKGWNEREVILLTGILAGIFGVTALFLNTTEKLIAAALLFGIMMILSVYTARK